MTTIPKNRASFSAAHGALLSIPYSATPGEVKNFDLGLSPFDTTAITPEDPPYLSSQVKQSDVYAYVIAVFFL